MAYKTVHCVGFSSTSVGGSDWWESKVSADDRFARMKGNPEFNDCTLVRFDLEVPDNAPAELITNIVDTELHTLGMQECIEVRNPFG